MTYYTAAVVSAGNHEVPDKWKEVEEEVEDRKARYALECLSWWTFNSLQRILAYAKFISANFINAIFQNFLGIFS